MFREMSMCRVRLVMVGTVTMLVAGCASREPSLRWTVPLPPDPPPVAQSDAMTVPNSDQPLSIVEAVRIACQRHSEVAVAEAELRVREQRVTTVKRQRRDPELRLAYGEDKDTASSESSGSETKFYTVPAGSSALSGASRDSSSESDSSDAYQVALRVFPRNPWAQSARVSQARAALHGAEAALRAANTSVAVAVCRAFADLEFAEQDVMLAEALVETRREVAEYGRELAQQGQTTLLDSAATLSRYLRALSDHAQSVKVRDEACAALGLLLHMPAEDLRVDWDGLPLTHDHMEDFPLEQLEEIALAARADVAQRAWERVALEASVKELKAAYIPWFGHLQASYGEQSASGSRRSSGSDTDILNQEITESSSVTGSESDREEWAVSAAVTLPVFSWWAQEHRVALAEHARARLLEEQAIEQMRQGIRAVRRRLSTLEAQRKGFNDSAAPVVREIEAIIRSGEDSPSLPPAELASLREQIIETRRLTLQADRARAMAQLDLCEALGGANLRPDILLPVDVE